MAQGLRIWPTLGDLLTRSTSTPVPNPSFCNRGVEGIFKGVVNEPTIGLRCFGMARGGVLQISMLFVCKNGEKVYFIAKFFFNVRNENGGYKRKQYRSYNN